MSYLAEKINSDKDFKEKACDYIRSELDKEISKPIRRRNFDRIEQLTAELSELTDSESDSEAPDTSKLYERIRSYEKASAKPLNVFKRFAPILCCVVLVLTVNCISVLAYDMNIVSAVIKFSKGGFTVDFSKNDVEEIILPTSEDDPFGFNAKLAEFGIEFETPHYIPEGYVLTNIDTNICENVCNNVRFIYEKGKKTFSMDFSFYWNEVIPMGIPSDDYNISERYVNGIEAIVSKEDNQYAIIYQKGKTVFYMYAVDVPYDECEKIVDSIS